MEGLTKVLLLWSEEFSNSVSLMSRSLGAKPNLVWEMWMLRKVRAQLGKPMVGIKCKAIPMSNEPHGTVSWNSPHSKVYSSTFLRKMVKRWVLSQKAEIKDKGKEAPMGTSGEVDRRVEIIRE